MPRALKLPSHPLPREIIDLIITTLISLHAHDPAYQWTSLRHITRFHKRELEHRFLHFWLPKLSISVYSGNIAVHYAAYGMNKRTGLIRFKARQGWDELQRDPFAGKDWAEIIMRMTWPVGDEARRGQGLILRLGEGVLSRGFAGGYIISDVMIPGLEVNEEGESMWFSWKALFSKIFGEEMLMRRLRDKLLQAFVPTIRATKPVTRHAAAHKFLRDNYQLQGREMLVHYRDHIFSSPDQPFSITPYLNKPKPDYKSSLTPHPFFPLIYDVVESEESMIFQVPGWASWGITEIARLRAEEEGSMYNFFPCEESIVASPHVDRLQRKWEGWLGKRDVNEETLEEELKVVKRWED